LEFRRVLFRSGLHITSLYGINHSKFPKIGLRGSLKGIFSAFCLAFSNISKLNEQTCDDGVKASSIQVGFFLLNSRALSYPAFFNVFSYSLSTYSSARL